MRALLFQGVRSLSCETVADPGIEAPSDAVLQVRVAAVCGSDLHVYEGRERGLDQGTVMGHEMTGEVVAVGSDVESLEVGDLVVSPFTTSCGACFYCASGLTSRCERGQLFGWVEGGRGLHGGQAELVRIPLADTTLVKVPPETPLDHALLAGDVLSTGFFAAASAGVGPGTTVAVLGCGPVGLMAVVASCELGAERVYAVDRLPERLGLAERFGAVPVDFSREDPVARLAEATDGRGADIALEAASTPAATRLAVDLLRPGGTVSAVAVHNEERLPFTPIEAYDKNLTYKTGRCPARHFMDRTLDIVAGGRYDLGAIVSHRLPLSDGPRGYRIFAERAEGCTKVLLHP